MPRMSQAWISILTALVALAALGVAAPTSAQSPRQQAIPFARGINILGYDAFWTDPAKARFQMRHLREIKAAGFDHVRINLFAFDRMDARNRLPRPWLDRLDSVVAESTRVGLGVIIDEHDFNDCSDNTSACSKKLSAFWSQVAPHFRNAPASVAFELLNEPHGALDASWNAFYPPILNIIRHSNPSRTVIIGPTFWNNFTRLADLKLPADDPNILVSFHYYDPFQFTHQGAAWTEMKATSGIAWGSAQDRDKLAQDFDTVAAWAEQNHRRIYLGEFGAYDGSGTPEAMRVAYTSAVAREAERHRFGWAYWQFDPDFIAWDMARDRWVEPIRNALIPK